MCYKRKNRQKAVLTFMAHPSSNLRPLPPENIYPSEILEFPIDFNM